MAYFEHDKENQPRRRRVFQEPVASELDDALEEADEEQYEFRSEYDLYESYDDDEYGDTDEDDLSDEEQALARRDRWQVLAGIGDFLAVIVGTAVILVLIALLVSLINWVHADISQSFTLWQTKI